MQWSDITRTPDPKVLRQFAGLCLVIGASVAVFRASRGAIDWRTYAAGGLGLGIGVAGLFWLRAVRLIYSGWMIAVFPIGWTISRLVIGGMFFLVFTPIAIVFRLIRRDALRLRRPRVESYWVVRRETTEASNYLRQY